MVHYPSIHIKIDLLNRHMRENHMNGSCTEETFMHFEYIMYLKGLMPPGIYSHLYEKYYLKN